MKKLEHLSEIYNSYNTFIIDLWGVMHNGITLNSKAIEVADNLLKKSKKIVFLSNAPRPSVKVKEFLIQKFIIKTIKQRSRVILRKITLAIYTEVNIQEPSKKFTLNFP